ncbi:MAG TPA: ATP-binding protein [Acidobacteriaceae bacterium]|jgi:signal transduction histidine kinase|nr:ATP-binding protein [Acidobacteriaceae bacterium]
MSPSRFGARGAWWRRAGWIGALVAVALLAGGIAGWRWFVAARPFYHDGFAQNRADEWHAVGGAWRLASGAMHNDSDERGAKMLTGSYRWRDYRLQTDVQLLGEGGDAGVVVRSNDEEPGVDAYDGYYVGVRMYDSSVVIGRSDHGWLEAAPVPLPGLRSHVWYHLDVAVVGCTIAATAAEVGSTQVTRAFFEEPDCVRSGRIGLRSLATGAAWRNVQVQPTNQAELTALAGPSPRVLHPDFPKSEAAFNASHNFPTFDDPALRRRFFTGEADPQTGPRTETSPIARVAQPLHGEREQLVTVRGTVSLTSPTLFVQDDTGGIALPDPIAPALNLGDEVEATGAPSASGDPIGATAMLPHARVRLLWDHTPAAPLSITAGQAATGNYDARLIELQGELEGMHAEPDGGMLVLDLASGAQAFRAFIPADQTAQFYRRLTPRSLLNLRGVCTLDRRYTQGVTSFALLLRSTEDIDRLAGPPWWTPKRLAEIGSAILLLCLLAQYLYGRAKQWRWRAIVQERERLAHELHDTLAQSFAGVAFQLQGIRNGLEHADSAGIARVNQQIELACDVVRQTHEEASLSIAMLREEWPAGKELGAALEECAASMVAAGNVEIVRKGRTDGRGAPGHIPVRVADALFHIGREAIVNSVRHADPRQIALSIEYQARSVVLTVEDEGRGFNPAQQTHGFGLRGMEKRARSIGAQLVVTSESGMGTRVRVGAPLEAHQSARGLFGTVWIRLRARLSQANAWRSRHQPAVRGSDSV